MAQKWIETCVQRMISLKDDRQALKMASKRSASPLPRSASRCRRRRHLRTVPDSDDESSSTPPDPTPGPSSHTGDATDIEGYIDKDIEDNDGSSLNLALIHEIQELVSQGPDLGDEGGDEGDEGELSAEDDDSDDDRPLVQPKISNSERAARQDRYASQMKCIVKALKDFTMDQDERRFMALQTKPISTLYRLTTLSSAIPQRRWRMLSSLLLPYKRSWCSGLRILVSGI